MSNNIGQTIRHIDALATVEHHILMAIADTSLETGLRSGRPTMRLLEEIRFRLLADPHGRAVLRQVLDALDHGELALRPQTKPKN